jgi:hypothetical protein
MLLVVLGLVAGACGDSAGGGGEITSCDDIVSEGLDMLQDTLDALGDLSLADIENLGDEPPEALADLETRGEELETKADELNCSDEELEASLAGRIDSLEAEGPFAELILEQLQSEIESGNFFDN